jgi:predicted metal-dependent enzyme (double-stranded beta helix superfamily)
MFDVDEFVARCRCAVGESDPLRAVQEVLERAVREPAGVLAALPATRAEIVPLWVAPDLTVLKVVWSPGMSIGPHNHLMWAAIGLYAGQEDNEFYRRRQGTIESSGGRQIRCSEVALLGPDVIHAVTNPLGSYTAAIHVYGGDLPHANGRSEWLDEPFEEFPFDFDRALHLFATANEAASDTH